jgi:hypothetical protein
VNPIKLGYSQRKHLLDNDLTDLSNKEISKSQILGHSISQNVDEQNVKEWLQHDKREIRQPQTMLMLLQNRSRMRMKQEVVTVSVTAWQYSVLIL